MSDQVQTAGTGFDAWCSIASLVLPVIVFVVSDLVIRANGEYFGLILANDVFLLGCGLGVSCAIISLVRRERWIGLSVAALLLNTAVGLEWMREYYDWSHHFRF